MFGKNYYFFVIKRLFVLFREVEGHKGTLKNAVNFLNTKLNGQIPHHENKSKEEIICNCDGWSE